MNSHPSHSLILDANKPNAYKPNANEPNANKPNANKPKVRDGHSLSSNLLGKFCGMKVPEQIMSTGDKLLVRFVSDSDVNRAGFSATFERELNECQSGSHGCSYRCSNQVSPYKCECPIGYELAADGKNCEPTCGGFKNDSMGSLNSPSFPDL